MQSNEILLLIDKFFFFIFKNIVFKKILLKRLF